jgi:hypothetical protein
MIDIDEMILPKNKGIKVIQTNEEFIYNGTIFVFEKNDCGSSVLKIKPNVNSITDITIDQTPSNKLK